MTKGKGKGVRTDRTSMTFPANVWRCYSAWCRKNGWYPAHRISAFCEKELERAGIDWRADSSFADVEVGDVERTLYPDEPTLEPVAPEPANTTDSPVEAVEPEDDEFAHINKMFKL